jgi:hypothetical protein
MRLSLSSMLVASLLGIGIGYYTFAPPFKVRVWGSN